MADEIEIAGVSLSHLENSAIQATLLAGDVAKRGFYSEFEVKTKSDYHDLVTDYDKLIEETIVSALRKEFPNHAFLCEESGKKGNLEDTPFWIIDPIDGTWNFAKQIPSFATSIALAYKGLVYVAVCNDPMANEMFTAKRGHGSFMNGKRLRVSSCDILERAGVSFRAVSYDTLPTAGVVRRSGSAVLDICYVAKGALEACVDYELEPWDFAAAALIVEEAGGIVSSLDQKPLSLTQTSETFIASNPFIYRKIARELRS